MSLRFSVLASGSTGNAIYIETPKQRLLVDAGLTGKKLVESLTEIGVNPSDLDGILVSHEHSDHIKGVGILSRRFHVPIYANEKTWQAMERSIGKISPDHKFHFESDKLRTFEDLDVSSFRVSHDAADPMFFSFMHEGRKLTVLTDTGYVSDHMMGAAEDSNVLLMESNHDVGMLRMGSYPWSTKRRILSDEGHVSNEDAGLALIDMTKNRKMDVYLSHLSLNNNVKEIATMTVQQTLQGAGIDVVNQVRLFDTDPYVPTTLKTV
ncbi:MBL fold metallo-hydrolase [Paenalkalicoccus suaedae]|uniref:MBL fold metallo-hydrolase n=1 Tax=Paenalkalicoccus suaedae TaxID=2592382 RepID=A0A859FKR0_9BACI|nr:MBL fold metallo-hydrolase [Paenalkalicoccus suaedae]QKS73372.1 MBL fold metallo-hydrolase [Paenalkalicoccus suaedae]